MWVPACIVVKSLNTVEFVDWRLMFKLYELGEIAGYPKFKLDSRVSVKLIKSGVYEVTEIL